MSTEINLGGGGGGVGIQGIQGIQGTAGTGSQGLFAQIYIAANISATAPNTNQLLQNFTLDQANAISLVNFAGTNDALQVTEAGRYKVNARFHSYNGDASSQDISIVCAVNGTFQLASINNISNLQGGDVASSEFDIIVNLNAGDRVNFYWRTSSLNLELQRALFTSLGYSVVINMINIAYVSQGIQGIQGTQGIQGLDGAFAAQGIQGTQGTQGIQGQIGTQGTTGTGIQGIQGVQGTIGDQGVQGATGTQGSTGIQGIQGVQGLQGIQGLQGVQGLQGFGTTGYFANVRQFAQQSAVAINDFRAVTWQSISTGNGFSITTNTLPNDQITAANTAQYAITARFNFVNTDSVDQTAGIFPVANGGGQQFDGVQRIIVPANGNAELVVSWITPINAGFELVFLFTVSSLLVSINNTAVGGQAQTACNVQIQSVIGIGAQGTQGTTGLQGLQGVQGHQGLQGLQGFQGLQGLQGLTGTGTTGFFYEATQYNTQIASAPNTNIPMPYQSVGGNGFSLTTTFVTNDTIRPANSGWYFVTARVSFTNTDTSDHTAGITLYSLSDSIFIPEATQSEVITAGNTHEIVVTTQIFLNANTGFVLYFSVSDVLVICETGKTIPSGNFIYHTNVTINNLAYNLQGVQGLQGLQGTQGLQGLDGAFAGQGVQGTQGVQGLMGTNGAGGAVGYYGSFYSTQDQAALTTNTETLFTYNNTSLSSGVSIVSSTQITFANTGRYALNFSSQWFYGGGGGTGETVDVWLKKNGTSIPDSNTKYLVPSNLDYNVSSLDFLLDLTAGDYIEIAWATDNTNIIAEYDAAAAPHPATPSIIVNAFQVTYAVQGTQGVQGVQGVQGLQGPQGTQGLQGVQGLQGISGTTGQNSTISTSSNTLSVTSATTTYTALAGIAQTINIPANCIVLLHTDGGFNTTVTTATGISTIEVAIFVDNVQVGNFATRRLSAFNPSSTAINSTGQQWSIDNIQTGLSAGSHTFDVRAVYVIGSTASVGANSSNPRQANLIVTILVL